MGEELRENYKKHFARILLCILVTVLYAGIGAVSSVEASDLGLSQELRLEQAHAEMPDIELYYYPGDNGAAVSPDKIQAEFNGDSLTVTSIGKYDEDSGIDYYMLLDISASISKEDFRSVQDAVIRFQSKMNQKDTLTLITFGNKVTSVFEKKTVADDCSSYIRNLKNDDMETALFDAIAQTAELVKAAENPMKRNIAFVISDGNDFSENKKSKSEALHVLSEASLPVYALAVEKTNRGEANGSINDFGEFSRSTGGQLLTFHKDNAWDSLKALRDGLLKARVMKLKAATNHTYQTLQPLSVRFDSLSPVSMDLLASHGKADTTIPTAEVTEISSKELQVTFSERVIHTEEEGNYRIVRDDGEKLVNYMVSWSESDLTATLTFDKELYNGSYTVSFSNICDDSMQANPVQNEVMIDIEDGYEEVELSAWGKFWHNYWIVVLAVVTVLIVLLILLIFYRRVKKNKGVVVVDGKVTFGENVDVKQEVKIEKQSGHEIIFVINDQKTGKKEIPMLVQESMFVGRSKMCDLYFNDPSLSAQHFVIEEGNDGFYIQDLNTTNGTMINGVKIHQRRKLKKGDVINAGIVEMSVRW